MARPRVFKLDNGEVSIQGFSTETANKLEEHISQFGKTSAPVAAGTEAPVVISDLMETSLGFGFNKQTKKWELTIVKFNPVTKQARVMEVKDMGDFKQQAVNKFKIELVERGFV